MIYKKNVLLLGLARTGLATLKYLLEHNANVFVCDMKTEKDLNIILDELKKFNNIQYFLGGKKPDLSIIDLVIVSPGVPLDTPFFDDVRNYGIKIIGDIELAYLEDDAPSVVAITGTNGKTTTTSMVGEILKYNNSSAYIVGNIGNPIMDTVGKSSCLIAEVSSFQLESIDLFSPNVSAILNIAPDHLNRHKTMQNYIDAKARIFKNQNEHDVTVLNYDNKYTRELASKCKSKVIFFSRLQSLDNGVYVDGENIYLSINSKKLYVMKKNELSLPGAHNLENALATIAISYFMDVDLCIVKKILMNFKAVEHRQEFVSKINEVTYINDSKATNPDSTIKALESYSSDMILIAGGKDKNNDFYDVIDVAKNNNVKAMVLLGETANIIESQANESHFKGLIIRVNSMSDAVKVSSKISKPGDIVLLSPACASLDKYSNFEERGNDFKESVLKISSN